MLNAARFQIDDDRLADVVGGAGLARVRDEPVASSANPLELGRRLRAREVDLGSAQADGQKDGICRCSTSAAVCSPLACRDALSISKIRRTTRPTGRLRALQSLGYDLQRGEAAELVQGFMVVRSEVHFGLADVLPSGPGDVSRRPCAHRRSRRSSRGSSAMVPRNCANESNAYFAEGFGRLG